MFDYYIEPKDFSIRDPLGRVKGSIGPCGEIKDLFGSGKGRLTEGSLFKDTFGKLVTRLDLVIGDRRRD